MNARDTMTMYTLGEAARDAGGRLEGADGSFTGVSTDSRAIAPGELFVALAGERHDAHEFVPQARARGAAGVLVSRADAAAGGPAIVVGDSRAGPQVDFGAANLKNAKLVRAVLRQTNLGPLQFGTRQQPVNLDGADMTDSVRD